jgi:hypothetical protein
MCTDHLLKHCPTSTELLQFLLHIPHSYLEVNALTRAILRIKLSGREVEKLEAKAETIWRKEAPTRGTASMKKLS